MVVQVRPKDLAQWLHSVRALGEPIVLDVREPHELQTASVTADGFTLVAIPMGQIPPRLEELDPQQPIACLCHHTADAANRSPTICKVADLNMWPTSPAAFTPGQMNSIRALHAIEPEEKTTRPTTGSPFLRA